MATYADQEKFDGMTFLATRFYGSKITGRINPSGKSWDSELDWCYREAASDFPNDRLLTPQMKQAMPLVWNALEPIYEQPEARLVVLHILFDYVCHRYRPDGTQRKKAFGLLDGDLFQKTHPNPSERVDVSVSSVPLYYDSAMRSGLYDRGNGLIGVRDKR